MESIGLVERAERIIILALTTIIAFLWQAQTQAVMNVGIILLAILTNLTVLQRSVHVYKKLKPSGA
jgi:phosphatidylglycerophosphate synthase